jgi:type IV pilus assembly protein PilC
MFKDMRAGAKLPALTQFFVDISHKFVDNIHWIGLIIASIIVLYVVIGRTRRGKRFYHRLLLSFPVIGAVVRKIVVARFSRTFGTLLSSGVPILEAMEICSKTVGNVIVEEAIARAKHRVSEGKDLANPLANTRAFPPMVIQMIAIGEQTGALDQMLQKIADFYEDEVDTSVAALTSMLEPLIMVVLGGIVGVTLIAMYLPIFEMAGNISGQ